MFSLVLGDESGNVRFIFWTEEMCDKFENEIKVIFLTFYLFTNLILRLNFLGWECVFIS